MVLLSVVKSVGGMVLLKEIWSVDVMVEGKVDLMAVELDETSAVRSENK